MQQIEDWLKKLGLSEYTERFVENDIDVSVLHYLTDQDLEKIGFSLGHRRKLLAARCRACRCHARHIPGRDAAVAAERCRASPSHDQTVSFCEPSHAPTRLIDDNMSHERDLA